MLCVSEVSESWSALFFMLYITLHKCAHYEHEQHVSIVRKCLVRGHDVNVNINICNIYLITIPGGWGRRFGGHRRRQLCVVFQRQRGRRRAEQRSISRRRRRALQPQSPGSFLFSIFCWLKHFIMDHSRLGFFIGSNL